MPAAARVVQRHLLKPLHNLPPSLSNVPPLTAGCAPHACVLDYVRACFLRMQVKRFARAVGKDLGAIGNDVGLLKQQLDGVQADLGAALARLAEEVARQKIAAAKVRAARRAVVPLHDVLSCTRSRGPAA